MINITTARPYCKAIFALALRDNQLSEWHNALNLLATTFTQCPDQALLLNIIKNNNLQHNLINLVKLLIENKKLKLLPQIASSYQQLFFEHEKILQVKVVAAQELDEVQKNSLIQALNKKYQQKISLQCQIDNKLIGGAIIYVANKVIDGSVKGALTQLRHEVLC